MRTLRDLALSSFEKIPTPAKHVLIPLIILIVSFIIHSSGLHITGFEHRSNDEFLYLKSTQEMIENQDYLSPTFFGEYRYQKPILFYWGIIGFYKLFGVSVSSARALSALCASITVLLTWLIARRLFDTRTALLSCLFLMSMPLFFAHTRTAVPDMALNMFIVLGFWAMVNFLLHSKNRIYPLVIFGSCALGFMIKGFPALVPLIALLFFITWTQQFYLFTRMRVGWGLLIMVAIIAPWFIFMIQKHGEAFLTHIMTQEVEQRVIIMDQDNLVFKSIAFTARNFIYYLKIIWNNLAPWTLFLFAGLPYLLRKQREESREAYAVTILLSCLYGVFFLYVFIALQQFNVQYMLTLSTPAAILSAYLVLKPIEANARFLKVLDFLRKFVCLIIFSIGFIIYAYLNIFFSEFRAFSLVMIAAIVYLWIMFSMVRSRDLFLPPAVLAVFIILVMSRMSFFEKNHLTQNSVFQEFALEIKARAKGGETIAIGETIDPMKFRVYFDTPLSQGWLSELFSQDDEMYVVFTERQLMESEEDRSIFERIAAGDTRELPRGKYAIIKQGKIVAKKMSLDADFFKGFLFFNKPKVRSYIFEDIYLIEKRKKG